jgi:hypothetical protein
MVVAVVVVTQREDYIYEFTSTQQNSARCVECMLGESQFFGEGNT